MTKENITDAEEYYKFSCTNPDATQTPYDVAQKEARYSIRKLFNNPHATFKSPQQEDMLTEIFLNQSNLLVILPTGGGKSLAWEATSFMEPNAITIVFTPFIALIQDQVRRAKSYGIKAIHWTTKAHPQPDDRLLFVSWELLNNPTIKK